MKTNPLTILTLAAGALTLLGCDARIKIDSKVTTASTNWSKWGGTKITSDGWNGTAVWQMRTNLETGEVELRGESGISQWRIQ